MNKTAIEWADWTWNPITGCYHNCSYCYAKRIAERFKPKDAPDWQTLAITQQTDFPTIMAGAGCKPFPCGFTPTLYTGRLDEPQKVKKPSRIFVVSMGDLFGDWVPDEWINQVMTAISKAPWHTYMMLTKNPERYWDYFEGAFQELPEEIDFEGIKILLGTSVTNQADTDKLQEWNLSYIDFLSIEPLLGDIDIEHILYEEYEYGKRQMDWVIVGAQTGPGAVKPKPEWVQNIIEQCREAGVPLFLKDNLGWHEKIQEWPKGINRG